MATLLEQCELVLQGANACSEHATGLEMKDIKEVIAAHYEDGYYAESSGEAVVLLNDGRYAVIWESEDTTGHG